MIGRNFLSYKKHKQPEGSSPWLSEKLQVHCFVFLNLPKLHPRRLFDQLGCFLDTVIRAVDAQITV